MSMDPSPYMDVRSAATFGSSEVTLINPDPPAEVIFTKYSTLNTTILFNGRPRYKVETRDAGLSKTDIKDLSRGGQGELIVKLRRKTLLGDTVEFLTNGTGTKKAMKQKDWLVEGKLGDGNPKWTIQTPVGTFMWRMDRVYRLVLCPETDLDLLLVYTQLPTLSASNSVTPLTLILSPGTEQFYDEIMTSYLIIEGNIREKEKRAQMVNGMYSKSHLKVV